MPAYNLVNGRPNHVSPLLEQQLRSWTDQPLVVCSDAGAPSNLVDSEHYFDTHEEATAASLKAGVDSFTDHGTDSTVMSGRIRDALAKGLIDESDIDRAVRRLLALRFALGEFDPELDPYAQVDALDTEEHRALALEAAEQAVVLLKNDGLLPLEPAPGRTVAVVGLLGDACKLDWYSGTLMHRSTPLDGIRERYGAENVLFTEGVDKVRLKSSDGWLQVPAADGATDAEARGAEGALDPALLAGRTDLPPLTCGEEATELALVDWGDGVLTLRTDEGLYLSVADDGYVRASADEPGGWVVQETFRLEAVEGHDGGHRLLHMGTGGYVSVAADGAKVAMSGEKISRDDATVLALETVEHGADAVARAAAAADTVIVVAYNDPHINGRETEDRTTLALPAQQDRLWRAAHAANPRTVLVLTSAYPYAVTDAAEALPALLWTAHGGQAAGTALARVIAGDVSPAVAPADLVRERRRPARPVRLRHHRLPADLPLLRRDPALPLRTRPRLRRLHLLRAPDAGRRRAAAGVADRHQRGDNRRRRGRTALRLPGRLPGPAAAQAGRPPPDAPRPGRVPGPRIHCACRRVGALERGARPVDRRARRVRDPRRSVQRGHPARRHRRCRR